MGLALLGFLKFNSISLIALIIISLSHGFCSSSLFYQVNYFYKKVNRRNLLISVFSNSRFPLFSFLLFLTCIRKASVPPTLSLIGEVFIIFININIFSFSLLIFIFYLFLVGLYKIYLYLKISHGFYTKSLFFNYPKDISFTFNLFFQVLPAFLLIFFLVRVSNL